MKFDSEAFAKLVIDSNVISFRDQPVTFKHGRQSQCYVNWRTAVNDAWTLDQVTDHILTFAVDQGLEPGCFYGVPEGATKLGVLTQYKWAKSRKNYGPGSHVVSMGRATPKEHGDPKDKFFVGTPVPPVAIVEDTTTTGGSLIKSIDKLQDAGIRVTTAIILTDRGEVRDDGLTVPQALDQKGVKYYALSSLKDLMPAAYEKLKPAPEVRAAVDAYFEKYGEK